jgi:GNAT superfamily N-acetyltransferase
MRDVTGLLDATWPAAGFHRAGPWTIREGRGGGKRVSAATAGDGWDAGDLPEAEAAMRALGQVPLFMLRPGEETLDTALAARGYGVVDPVEIWQAPVARLTGENPFLAAFPHWPPLAVMQEIWAEDGIGPERLAVMDRVAGPKAAVLGRTRDRPAGAAFVALHEGTAMLHALVVSAAARRKGCGRALMREAANWAAGLGAERLNLAVTRANGPARALYAALGMEVAGGYHYRQARDEGGTDG